LRSLVEKAVVSPSQVHHDFISPVLNECEHITSDVHPVGGIMLRS